MLPVEHQLISNFLKIRRIKFNLFNCSDSFKKSTQLKVFQQNKLIELYKPLLLDLKVQSGENLLRLELEEGQLRTAITD